MESLPVEAFFVLLVFFFAIYLTFNGRTSERDQAK
jgi:hypothetical protein